MKKKRIGLITFHCADNFGAVLQAHALQKYINTNFSVNVEIIDYRPSTLIYPYRLRLSNNTSLKEKIKFIIKKIVFQRKYNERSKKYEEFRMKYLEISEIRNISKEMLNTLANNYDCFLVGSDQVWNPSFVNEIGTTYLLDFLPKSSYKISYASSVVEKIPKKLIHIYQEYLEHFNSISVREEESKNILKNIIDKDICVNIDPVFLLEKDYWEQLIKVPFKKPKKDYILVFDYVIDNEYTKIINTIVNCVGLECISFSINHFWIKRYVNNKKSIFFEGPSEILWYIKNASLVITSSFHALAFSIIFEKKFLCLLHPSRGNRMIDILNKLDLSKHIIDRNIDKNTFSNLLIKLINNNINYDKDKLELFKNEAFVYINRVINFKK